LSRTPSIHDASYIYWRVDITADSGIEQFGYTRDRDAIELLSWSERGTRFYDSLEAADIFLDRLPALRLKRADLFRENRLGLFFDAGAGPQRLRVSGDQDTADIQIPAKVPCQGRIWIEPIGNLRGGGSQYTNAELRFLESGFYGRVAADAKSFDPNPLLNWQRVLVMGESQVQLHQGEPVIRVFGFS
jgi:hypothetical protein